MNSCFRLQGRWKNRPETVLISLLLICMAGYGVCSACGFLIFPDEYTYWSYAAAFAGYDWSPVTSLGAYYSYGYSMILFPVFLLCKNPVVAYRAAVGVNFALLLLALLCLIRFIKKNCGEDGALAVLFSAVAVFYAGHLFNAQMTLTETLLFTLYVIAGVLLYGYLANNDIRLLAALLTVLFYMYSVHMRTVGVLFSALAVLLFHQMSKRGRKSHILLMAVLLAVFAAVGGFIKDWSYGTVFGGMNAELVSGNDYRGQLDKIKYIFTTQGFYDTSVHILGKLLYLGLSTFGIFVFGVGGMVKKAVSPEEKPEVRKFSAYVLLTAAAQIVIGTVYLLTLGEISDYTYGRYNELILPFLMIEGMLAVRKMRAGEVWTIGGAAAFFHLVITEMVVRQIDRMACDNFCGYFMTGICWLYDEKTFTPERFFWGAYLFGTALTLVAIVVLLLSRSGKNSLLVCLIFMEVATAVKTDRTFLVPFKQAAYRDGLLAEKIEKLCGEKEEPRLLFRYEDYPAYIGILQFMLPERRIETTGRIGEGDVGEETILIFPFDDREQDKWRDRFLYQDVYGHFSILYD